MTTEQQNPQAAEDVRRVARPAVVLDRVAMTYTVPTRSEKAAAELPWGRRVSNTLLRRKPTVKVHALKPLSLVVEHGEAVGIVGRNGSGKSTLSKLISGQLAPTSGAVYASSTPILLGVNAALQPTLSGRQNVYLGCLAMGMQPAEIDAKFESIVRLANLPDEIDLPMGTYSAGMASRLRFAIAASVDPEILVIDEALNTGDAAVKERTKVRMDELRAQAGCVFLVSHSIGVIKDITLPQDPKERNVAIELMIDRTMSEFARLYRRVE